MRLGITASGAGELKFQMRGVMFRGPAFLFDLALAFGGYHLDSVHRFSVSHFSSVLESEKSGAQESAAGNNSSDNCASGAGFGGLVRSNLNGLSAS
jgi:hypothetical protein